MKGVILFADDHIFDYSTGQNGEPSSENRLYRFLSQEQPVLGIKSRQQIRETISSIGSFTAVILDWQFDEEDQIEQESDDDESVLMIQKTSQKEHGTYNLLMQNDFYSLVYIYSDAKDEVEMTYGEKLKNKFKNRIEFRDKTNLSNTESEASKLLDEIRNWKTNNEKIAIPISWSQAINRSVQSIFSKLNSIDPNWLKEYYNTAKTDGVSPSVEVINLFQNILSELIIQNEDLRTLIDTVDKVEEGDISPESYAELTHILYYGSISENDPIMTGDIFKLDESKYGIIITPECNIRNIKINENYEMLCFSNNGFNSASFTFNANLKASTLVNKVEELLKTQFTNQQRRLLIADLNNHLNTVKKEIKIGAFTQTNYPSMHFLPCFEFEKGNYGGIALIDFKKGFDLLQNTDELIRKRIAKLNTPFIQELRQRYFAYKGRIGVPSFSKKLKQWLVDNN
ncbi:hypothetical protein BA6E_1093 [Bacteroidales bacterium 6E]|nr:hypothetical protein BA6E_1093 [Bacteroidales bacterium 6E]